MQDQASNSEFETGKPAFLKMMGGSIAQIDASTSSCTMTFELGREFCHSIDIVQGGFVTAMLDAAMSHSVFCNHPGIISVATMDINVSFYEPSRAGRFRAHGTVRKMGRSTGFLAGELFDDNGLLLATATTTAKLIRKK